MLPKGYTQRAEELVDLVKKLKVRPISSEDKDSIHPKKLDVKIIDLTCLIGAGADILQFNIPQTGDSYLHKVTYQDYEFVAVTKEPHQLEISQAMRY